MKLSTTSEYLSNMAAHLELKAQMLGRGRLNRHRAEFAREEAAALWDALTRLLPFPEGYAADSPIRKSQGG